MTDWHAPLPAVMAYLKSRQAAMQRLLSELVAAESPSTDPAAQAPVLELLAGALARSGYRTRRISGEATGGHLFARPAHRMRGTPFQLLVGHSDTVWPTGTLTRMPLEVQDGSLRGPGSFDMKGGLAQMIFALEALSELGVVPQVTPVVFVNSDEEIGSIESNRWIEALAKRSDRAMILEPALGPEGRLKTARKGVGQFRVTIGGVSAHTGLDPGRGASAIEELAHVVIALHALTDADRGITVNVGRIEGGVRPNVVAPEARAVVDVRVPTLAAGRELENLIRSIRPVTPGTTIEVEGGVEKAPLERTPRNRRLWHLAEGVAAVLGIEVGEATAGGGSDGNTTSLFTATLDGLGSIGDGAHAAHEFVSVDRMAERAALLAGLILAPPLGADPASDPSRSGAVPSAGRGP